MLRYFSLLCILLLSFAGMAQVDITKAPQPDAPGAIKIGNYSRFTLDNGLKVFVIENAARPKLSITLDVHLEPVNESPEPELRSIVNSLLYKGTAKMDPEALRQKIDFIGANFGSSINGITAQALNKYRDQMFGFIEDCLYAPYLTEEGFDAAKAEYIAGLEARLERKKNNEKKKVSVSAAIRDSIMGMVQSAKKVEPTLEKARSLTLADAKAYYARKVVPNNSHLTLIGNIGAKEARKVSKKLFGRWKASGENYVSTFIPSSEHVKLPNGRIIYVIDKPGVVQSKLSYMWPLFDVYPYTHNESKVKMLSAIFGEHYASNLNKNLRLQKGWTYGAYGRLSSSEAGGSGMVNVQVKTENTAGTIENIELEMLRIMNDPIPDRLFGMAKNSLIGDYTKMFMGDAHIILYSFSTARQRYDLPDDYLETHVADIESITKEDLVEIAGKYMKPYNCLVIIEGDAKALKGKLDKFGNVTYLDEEGHEL